MVGTGVCAVLPTDNATITQDGNTTTFVGLAVLKEGFFAYHVVGLPEIGLDTHLNNNLDNGPSTDPLLVFGGTGYNFGTPSGKTYAFNLLPDIKEAVLAPFAGGGSFPEIDLTTDQQGNFIKPLPVISDLLYLEKDGGANDQSRAVWLQTSFYINTTPGNGDNIDFDQQSFVNIALGGVDPVTGGLVGARRGGASVDFDTCDDGCINREQFAFIGDIASLAGPG